MIVGIFYLIYSAYYIASDIDALRYVIIIILVLMYVWVWIQCFSTARKNTNKLKASPLVRTLADAHSACANQQRGGDARTAPQISYTRVLHLANQFLLLGDNTIQNGVRVRTQQLLLSCYLHRQHVLRVCVYHALFVCKRYLFSFLLNLSSFIFRARDWPPFFTVSIEGLGLNPRGNQGDRPVV